MQQSELKIALLIDADNAPASKVSAILSEIAKYGVANIRKAYGNWKSPAMKSWEDCLHKCAIRPVQQFDYTKGKNATDAAIIIDAMDLLYTQRLDAFAIVSSDCDFTPLVMRILTNGLKVYGFGEAKTPLPFVSACSTFLYLEKLSQAREAKPSENLADAKKPANESKKSTPANESKKSTKELKQCKVLATKDTAKQSAGARKSTKELRQDAKLVALLRSAVADTQDDSGWSELGQIGISLSNQAWFNPRNYGYAKLSGLIKAIDLFEVQRKDKTVFVRNRQKSSVSKALSA
jgi:uncharacterized LabA/DUF88 family protein